MKLKVLRQDRTVLVIVAMMAVLALVGISWAWPDFFGIALAIGGTFGALMVIYEIRLTKRIAQAEFIRDLQSSFSSDERIGELWRKLLNQDEITEQDRSLVSSYLTFFETLHLLLARRALELPLTDDLFRNRFFTAIGDPGVLRTALAKQAGSFANIHDLVEIWHNYLLEKGIPLHPGYYRYAAGMSAAKGFPIERLTEADLDDLMELQDTVLASMGPNGELRKNTREMLKECLTRDEHHALGARCHGTLVAAAILYDGKDGDESIRKYFTEDEAALTRSMNLKNVLVHPEHRRAGLARTLVELLEEKASGSQKAEVLTTIHPQNRTSRLLFQTLGYKKVGSVETSYGTRDAYARTLPSLKKRWARSTAAAEECSHSRGAGQEEHPPCGECGEQWQDGIEHVHEHEEAQDEPRLRGETDREGPVPTP
ncbi:MAG: GNAT family N-acetyltransferase [Actinomycetia bacterium]|nr:GNAT family N-acetyltransferase [Actinomycetes bacterium]